MTVISPGSFIRRAALAAAAVFATPMNAPAHDPVFKTVSAQPLRKIDIDSPFPLYFRGLLTFIGRDLNAPPSAAQAGSLRDNVLMLQQSLNLYGKENPHLHLTSVDEDGIMGKHTAQNMLHVIHAEKIFDVLIIPYNPHMAPEDAHALKTASDLLATLQPVMFAEKLRAVIVTPPEDLRNSMNVIITALRQSFRECTARDGKSFAADIADREIDQINAESGYVSKVIQTHCARILHRLPMNERAQAQMEYMNTRIRHEPPTKDEWCKIHQHGKCLMLAL